MCQISYMYPLRLSKIICVPKWREGLKKKLKLKKFHKKIPIRKAEIYHESVRHLKRDVNNC